jgi:RNase P protein component
VVARSKAARLLRKWVRNPPGAWKFVCYVCCVLSGRTLSDELITRPEETYRLWRVVVCDHETSWYEEAIARAGVQSQRNKQIFRALLAHSQKALHKRDLVYRVRVMCVGCTRIKVESSCSQLTTHMQYNKCRLCRPS